MTCCLFDVNETLLDLSGLDAVFLQIFGSSTARHAWFAQTLQNALVSVITGPYIPFEEAGQAALTMQAQRENIQLSEADRHSVKSALRMLPAHADALPALKRLRQSGVRLVALTNNARELAELQLTAAGLRDQFDEVLSAEAAHTLKPAAPAYLQTAKTLALPPDQLWLIAVHAWDIAGAQRAGLRTALVMRDRLQVPSPLAPPTVQGADLTAVAEQILTIEKG
ncbi:2-haloacid dehalogenase [Pseudomonas duriflava]|uniref:(S)-2-haloacid dehalogenase n=1 Tax=Pseudomonas duriflava TaxID=459528 RepID=A0A562QG61_9PSED|nr:haloacid dehalogenase type II [Pseudomonas duriflava]TWI55721.1 2-haloacid dehalogenase [Pseudomonas duriflava]